VCVSGNSLRLASFPNRLTESHTGLLPFTI
jgi:hypothetical protein